MHLLGASGILDDGHAHLHFLPCALSVILAVEVDVVHQIGLLVARRQGTMSDVQLIASFLALLILLGQRKHSRFSLHATIVLYIAICARSFMAKCSSKAFACAINSVAKVIKTLLKLLLDHTLSHHFAMQLHVELDVQRCPLGLHHAHE